MIREDLADIERALDLCLPASYKKHMEALGDEGGILYNDKEQIIAANLRCRISAWDGKPLDKVFFIIGADLSSKEYMIDLDVPGEMIMVAGNDSDDPSLRVTVVGLGFDSWINTQKKNFV